MNVEALEIIHNESLQTGVEPEDWRQANVRASFKKGSNAEELQAGLTDLNSL